MKFRGSWAAGLALVLAGAVAPPTRAQSGTIEDVQVVGLVRMTNEAFGHAFAIRAGDPYDPATIRRQYRRLWDLALFDDLTIDAEDGPGGGKVLIVRVKERRVLTSIAYQDNKVLTRTAIEDRLKEKKIALEIGKALNLKAIFDTQAEIRNLLGEKGYLDPAVGYKVETPSESSAGVSFTIRPGAKTRIRSIDFVDNEIYSDRRLYKQLKLTREWKWYWPLTSKTLYHPAKWDQDSGGIRDLYLNTGYLDVEIRPPVVDVREVRREGKTPKRKKAEVAAADQAPSPEPPKAGPASSERKLRRRADSENRHAERSRRRAEKALKKAEPKVRRWVYLTVPVREGKPYTTGTITVSGNTVFTEAEVLRGIAYVREGATVNNALLETASKGIQRQYQDRGYAYATVRREIVRREGGETIADVRIAITEDRPYRVDRIDFTGNTQTQDRVLRREFRLAEGDLFSQTALDVSLRKLNQLGYFGANRDDVVVAPVEGSDKVKITVPGEEKGRNEIQVGGGYSGLDGAFFTGFYSTRNLLGRGQILSTSVQVGGRANRYQIAFSEPWFLGRPYNLGFSVYRRDVDYGRTQRSSARGGGVTLGRFVGNWAQVGTRYDYQKVTSQGFQFTSSQATNEISSLTPSFSYNRVNDPYRPSRGWSLGSDLEVAGGPLGGDTSYVQPRLIYSGYLPFKKRTFVGVHAEAGLIRPWQGGSRTNTANINGIPRFQRFWLGGDTFGPRVFETRTVTPLRYVRLDPTRQFILETAIDPRDRPASDFDLNGDGVVDRRDLVDVGGDRYFMFQTEYVIPVQGTMEVAFFADVGNSLFEDTSWGFRDMRASAGVEVRFYIPVFPVPLRLIYGVPIRKLPEDRTSAFTFSIGRSF